MPASSYAGTGDASLPAVSTVAADWSIDGPNEGLAMNLFSRLRIRTKLALLTGLSGLVLAVAIFVAGSLIQQRMIDDRIDKLSAVVHISIGVAQSLEDQVAAHQLTHDQALELFRKATHVMRFDAGQGYVFVQTLDNVVVVHGADPTLENRQSPARDASGTLLTSRIVDALRNADEGAVLYAYARPGQARAQPKVAYVARFAPWGVVFAAGAYTDDLDAAVHVLLWKLALSGGATLLGVLAVAGMINRDFTRPLAGLKDAMLQLSQGDLVGTVPGTHRRDEVGAMAGAVLVFQKE
jgi:methyl-accepting chemotaxis protein